MAFKKELCTGKEGHTGILGGKDSSWTGSLMDFMLPFFIELNLEFVFVAYVSTWMLKWFICTLFVYVGIASVGIAPSYPECQPWTNAFLVPPPPTAFCFLLLLSPQSSLSDTCSQRAKQTHKKVSLAYVTNSMCECMIKDHWRKKRIDKKNRQGRRGMVNYFLLLLLIW